MIVAVIPAYNEWRTTGSVALLAQKHVDEVIVVDDGSSDLTSDVAEAAGTTIVELDENCGKGYALSKGVARALTVDPDCIVLLDSDGQHNPSYIPDITSPIVSEGVDVVIGKRSISGVGEKSRLRNAGRNILDTMTNISLDDRISDTQSGFRALTPDVAAELCSTVGGHEFESEMLIQAEDLGCEIAEVEISEDYPDETSQGLNPFLQGLSVFRYTMRVIRNDNPLLFFGVTGGSFAGLGVIFGTQTAVNYYQTNVFWPGKAMLSMLCLLLGTQLIITALLLDYMEYHLNQ